MTGAEFALWFAPAPKGFRSGRRAARGGATMDAKTSESGHLMLITPERVFYAGLLGRPRERCPGALHVYVDQGRLVAHVSRWRRALRRTGRRAAECPPHHRQRLSLGDLPGDRAGERSIRHVRRTVEASSGGGS